ncbi:MAG: hypothetical protein AAFP90_02535, partial [Planctomycetota bacterium]
MKRPEFGGGNNLARDSFVANTADRMPLIERKPNATSLSSIMADKTEPESASQHSDDANAGASADTSSAAYTPPAATDQNEGAENGPTGNSLRWVGGLPWLGTFFLLIAVVGFV